MGKYLKEFELTSQYEEYINSTMALLPNVSLVNETTGVFYNSIVDYTQQCITFEALEDGTFSFTKSGTGDDIQYSKDNGNTWTPLVSGETVSVVTGDKVMWKSTITPKYNTGIGTFSSSNKFNVYGNAMSLLYGDGFIGQTSIESKKYTFTKLFWKNSGLFDASNLILSATTLVNECYCWMFNGCTSLTTAPELPATTLYSSCYYNMFSGCTSLTMAPKLPATILSEHCYKSMFSRCTSLTTAPKLPATTLANYCYSHMFSGCTSLTTAPELPATTLDYNCYVQMFYDCTSLNHITMLATDIPSSNCLSSWVTGVSSTGTFVKHPDMESLPTGTSGIPNSWTVVDYTA